MKNIKILNIILILFICISCKRKQPDTSTVPGTYTNNDNINDFLILSRNGTYYRIIDNDTIVNGHNWDLSDDDVFFEKWKWVNGDYFPKEFSEQSPILNCRYDMNGVCIKIEINSDGDYFKKH